MAEEEPEVHCLGGEKVSEYQVVLQYEDGLVVYTRDPIYNFLLMSWHTLPIIDEPVEQCAATRRRVHLLMDATKVAERMFGIEVPA